MTPAEKLDFAKVLVQKAKLPLGPDLPRLDVADIATLVVLILDATAAQIDAHLPLWTRIDLAPVPDDPTPADLDSRIVAAVRVWWAAEQAYQATVKRLFGLAEKPLALRQQMATEGEARGLALRALTELLDGGA